MLPFLLCHQSTRGCPWCNRWGDQETRTQSAIPRARLRDRARHSSEVVPLLRGEERVLRLLDGELAIVRLPPDAAIPLWLSLSAEPLVSVTRTAHELSIVCPAGAVPAPVPCEAGWRAFMVEGKLEFSAVGVLSAILNPLAEAAISILSLSTFDTDYVLVRFAKLEAARAALRENFVLIEENQS